MKVLKIFGGKIKVVFPALCITIASAFADDISVSATASTAIAVDSREGEARMVAPEDIGYSPKWSGVTDENSHVVIYKVEHAGMFNATTSVLETCAAGAEDVYAFSPGSGDAKCVRLIHRVFDSNDVETGTTLVRDVAFAVASSESAAAAVDSQDGLLQRAVDSDVAANFSYDTSWMDGVSSVILARFQFEDGRHAPVVVSTQTLFSASADASGAVARSSFPAGGWRYLLTFLDSHGDAVGEPLTAGYFKKGSGFMLLVR